MNETHGYWKVSRFIARSTCRRFVTWCLACVAAIMLATWQPANAANVSLTRIGEPTWQPVDFQPFSAPGVTSFEEFLALFDSLFPPPNHVRLATAIENAPSFLGPGAAHTGPYDSEASQGLQNLGLVSKEVYSLSEFDDGVFLTYLLVPTADAPNGPSPDFQNGLILPNDMFPITGGGQTLREGELFEDNGPVDIPSLNTVGMVTDPDGNSVDFTGLNDSHILLFWGTASFFGPPGTEPKGDYEFTGSLRDATGAGWDYSVPFRVVPEPSCLVLALGFIPFIAWCRFRSSMSGIVSQAPANKIKLGS